MQAQERDSETVRVTENNASLLDLWAVISRYKWFVLGLPVVVVVASAAIASMLSPQWEAIALIRIGQVGHVGQGATPIETSQNVVERLKQRGFQDAVLGALGRPTSHKDSFAEMYRDTLKVRHVPNTDLVRLQVRAHSGDEARQNARATFEQLRKIHELRAAESATRLKQYLVSLNERLNKVRRERENLINAASKKTANPSGGQAVVENVVLSDVLNRLDQDLARLERESVTYEELFSPMRTYDTALIEDISISDEPVWPRTGLLVVFSGVAALVVGILGAFLLDGIRTKGGTRPHATREGGREPEEQERGVVRVERRNVR